MFGFGFGAPTPPAGGGSGSGGPAVDSTARAAAAAAQADATSAAAALTGSANDATARAATKYRGCRTEATVSRSIGSSFALLDMDTFRHRTFPFTEANNADPDRITIPEGVSWVRAQVGLRSGAASTGSVRSLKVTQFNSAGVVVNEDLAYPQIVNAQGNGTLSFRAESRPVQVSAGDYFQAFVATSPGGGTTVVTPAGHCFLEIEVLE